MVNDERICTVYGDGVTGGDIPQAMCSAVADVVQGKRWFEDPSPMFFALVDSGQGPCVTKSEDFSPRTRWETRPKV